MRFDERRRQIPLVFQHTPRLANVDAESQHIRKLAKQTLTTTSGVESRLRYYAPYYR